MSAAVHELPATVRAALDAMRTRMLVAPGMAGEAVSRVEALLGEAVPFVEAAERARGLVLDDARWREARSLAFLFAYRMGDQGFAPMVLHAAAAAWRDAVDGAWSRAAFDDVVPMLTEGYARGREDRVTHDQQRALGTSLPVVELAPGVALVVCAGALDDEAARCLCDRAGALMLRASARAVLLDLTGLVSPAPATLSELWGITSAARMLGAGAVVVAPPTLRAATEESGVRPEAGTRWAESWVQGIATARDLAGDAAWRRWLRRVAG